MVAANRTLDDMRIRILGCSGGIGAGARTSAMLVDDDVLIDAGTGIGDLALAELQPIRHVFLTHAHLDHIAGLPLLVDTVFDEGFETPVTVYARAETLRGKTGATGFRASSLPPSMVPTTLA